MRQIITDTEKLKQKSGPITNGDVICKELGESIPKNALGLAAPQIDIFERAFIANLSIGCVIFLNPEIIWMSPDLIPSIESCLSLPGITKCVSRANHIKVKADKIIGGSNTDELISFKGLDACIVQHETDHLNGILITDLQSAKTREQKIFEKAQKKMEKKHQNKEIKKDKEDKRRQLQIKLSKNIKKDERHKKLLKRMVAREEFLLQQKNVI